MTSYKGPLEHIAEASRVVAPDGTVIKDSNGNFAKVTGTGEWVFCPPQPTPRLVRLPWNDLLSWQRAWFERGFHAVASAYGSNPVSGLTPEQAYNDSIKETPTT